MGTILPMNITKKKVMNHVLLALEILVSVPSPITIGINLKGAGNF